VSEYVYCDGDSCCICNENLGSPKLLTPVYVEVAHQIRIGGGGQGGRDYVAERVFHPICSGNQTGHHSRTLGSLWPSTSMGCIEQCNYTLATYNSFPQCFNPRSLLQEKSSGYFVALSRANSSYKEPVHACMVCMTKKQFLHLTCQAWFICTCNFDFSLKDRSFLTGSSIRADPLVEQ